jgi:photosystem II stability/assembly factor-like uncharacterized protein
VWVIRILSGWQRKSGSLEMPPLDSLQYQLAQARENLRIIQERKAEFVLSTEVLLQLVKEERQLIDKIAELEQQLGPRPVEDGSESAPKQLPRSGSKIIVLISLIASCITIFVFCTSITSVPELMNRLLVAGNGSPSITTFVPQTTSPTKAPLSTSTTTPAFPWISLGLADYQISQIAIVSDSTLYAGTNENSAGIFKSSDSGKTWRAINNGLGGLNISSLAVVPDNPNIVYAVAKGLWATKDGGKSWSPGNVEAAFEFVAVLSDNGDRLIVDGQLSQDGGKNWSNSTDDMLTAIVGMRAAGYRVQLVASTSDYSTLYVTGGRSLYKSRDGGVSWLKVPPVRDKIVMQLSVSPTDSNMIYACTLDSGIFRSSDGMGSWEPVNNNLPAQGNNLQCVAVLAGHVNAGKVYAAFKGYGLYTSTDKGDTWTLLAPYDKEIKIIAEDLKSSSILVGTTNGIWQLKQ